MGAEQLLCVGRRMADGWCGDWPIGGRMPKKSRCMSTLRACFSIFYGAVRNVLVRNVLARMPGMAVLSERGGGFGCRCLI